MNKREFKRLVDELIRKGVNGGWSVAEYKRQLQRLFERSGYLADVNEKYIIESANKFTKLFAMTAGKAVREATAEILNASGDLFKLVGDNVSARSAVVIERALRQGLTTQQFTKLIRDKITSLADYQIRGIVNTANTAFDTASVIAPAIDAGIKKFKYVGPSPEREFCINNINKVFTIEQLKKMRNGQGLPVLYFRGGYNCQHGLEPFFESKN